MKKLIKTSVLLFGVCFIAGKAAAQLSSDAPAMTAAQVAEIQKKQTAAMAVKPTTAPTQSVSTAATVPTNIVAGKQPAAQTMVPAKVATISDQGAVTPVLIYTEPKVAPVSSKPVQVTYAKTVPVETVPSPAIQTIPAGTLKSSVASQPPVTTASSPTLKLGEVNNAPATLVPMPSVNIATGNGTQPVVAPVLSNMPQQTSSEAKPAQIATEIPNSIVSPAPKLPAVTNQSAEKSKGKN